MKNYDERTTEVYAKMKKILRRKNAIAAVCSVMVVAVIALVLFVPYNTTPPSVARYSGSPYYSVIQKLNEFAYDGPQYYNNYEALMSQFGLRLLDKSVVNEAMGVLPDGTGGDYFYGTSVDSDVPKDEAQDGEYVEVTDNQVAGVIEADIFKRSTEYIYYLRGTTLKVYSIAGEDSQEVGSFALEEPIKNDDTKQDDVDMWGDLYYYNSVQMYLSADCRTVTLLLNGFFKTMGTTTMLVNLDVTDPANIRETNRVYFTGSYVSSRVVDGDILLTYNYSVLTDRMDFGHPETFVPQYGIPGDMTCIPGDDVICPDDVDSARYTVICKVDGSTLEVKGSTALLSYAQNIYVSEDTIFATHSYTERNQEIFNNQYRQDAMTEISGISYAGDGLEILGTIAVEGSVKNQYSMDAYEGILRVVTSTTKAYFEEVFYNEFAYSTTSKTDRNVNLYCIDLEKWEVTASVIGFAPAGEAAESVRFDGVNAYVCTAEVITLTDPVYFFDLSDLENITWTDTGTIDGYSTSLIQLGDGYLLGIGYGDGWQLKIEVYQEYKDSVVSVCTYERYASFSENYKAYLIDRENDLIGLAVSDWDDGKETYVLLHFDGYQLNEIATVESESGYILSMTRACMVDGYLYVLSQSFDVQKVW